MAGLVPLFRSRWGGLATLILHVAALGLFIHGGLRWATPEIAAATATAAAGPALNATELSSLPQPLPTTP